MKTVTYSTGSQNSYTMFWNFADGFKHLVFFTAKIPSISLAQIWKKSFTDINLIEYVYCSILARTPTFVGMAIRGAFKKIKMNVHTLIRNQTDV